MVVNNRIQKKLLSESESNSILYNIRQFKLLFSFSETNLAAKLSESRRLLSLLESIFSSDNVGKTFLYFLWNGAATAWILQVNLEMPEATVYRCLKKLRALKLVIPATRASKEKSSRGGPRPTVWALIGTSDSEVADALRLHYRALSPKYRVAEEVFQTIMTDYVQKRGVEEISYKEIRVFVRERKVPESRDITELVANLLHENGIKVWR